MNELQINSTMSTGFTAAARIASSLTSPAAAARNASQAAGAGAAQSSGSSSTITANDFLTLLVSELKNQDPTQPTDPNAYIQQLVGVNSLQQLIQINQGLTALESGVAASATANLHR
jgi:flagellar basal-body rod modification protein FlgD